MKRFIKITALLLAMCALFGMTSCDIIVGELENIVEMIEEEVIGDVFDDVFDGLFDGEGEVMVALEGKYGSTEIDSKMMSYFFNKYLARWFTTYGMYVGSFGLDVNKDLDEQWIDGGSSSVTMFLGGFSGTWMEYFYYETVEEVQLYLIWADYAESCGISLDDEDLIDIEKCINEEYEKMEKTGTKIKDWYGKGVDEDVIRRCLELQYLAAKGSDYYTNNVENSISYSELEHWAEYNREEVLVADCLSYTITVSSQNVDFADYQDLCVEARNVANDISQAGSVDEFKRMASAASNMGYAFDTPSDVVKETLSYGDESEVSEWIFNYGASNGETRIFENYANSDNKDDEKDEYSSYEKFEITVYFVAKAPYYDERLAHSVAYAVMSNEEVVRAIRDEVISLGVTDGVEFMSIANRYANEYSNDTQGAVGILTTVKPDEYLYVENMEAGYFADDYKALNEWVEDDGRRPGDVSDVIKFENKLSFVSGTNGSFSISGSFAQSGDKYAVALFVGHGEETWKAKAREQIVAGRLSDAYDEFYYNGSWMISGNYDSISVGNLSLIRSQSSSGLIITYSEGAITYAPEYSGGIKYAPEFGSGITYVTGDGDYSYTITDPNGITVAPGGFEYDYIVTDPNYTIVTPADPSQPEN